MVESWVIIALLLATMGLLTLLTRFQRDMTKVMLNLVSAQANAMTSIRDEARANHLQLMRQFKGKSYVGQFGDFDMHTDPNVPPGGPWIMSTKSPMPEAPNHQSD